MNPSQDLVAFIEIIAADAELRRALAQEKSNDAFARACVALAAKQRLHITANEVRDLLRARTAAWHQRNVR